MYFCKINAYLASKSQNFLKFARYVENSFDIYVFEHFYIYLVTFLKKS